MLHLLLSLGAVDALIPLIIILILIAAAAGLSRGYDIFSILGIGVLAGIGGTTRGRGTLAGKSAFKTRLGIRAGEKLMKSPVGKKLNKYAGKAGAKVNKAAVKVMSKVLSATGKVAGKIGGKLSTSSKLHAAGSAVKSGATRAGGFVSLVVNKAGNTRIGRGARKYGAKMKGTRAGQAAAVTEDWLKKKGVSTAKWAANTRVARGGWRATKWTARQTGRSAKWATKYGTRYGIAMAVGAMPLMQGAGLRIWRGTTNARLQERYRNADNKFKSATNGIDKQKYTDQKELLAHKIMDISRKYGIGLPAGIEASVGRDSEAYEAKYPLAQHYAAARLATATGILASKIKGSKKLGPAGRAVRSAAGRVGGVQPFQLKRVAQGARALPGKMANAQPFQLGRVAKGAKALQGKIAKSSFYNDVPIFAAGSLKDVVAQYRTMGGKLAGERGIQGRKLTEAEEKEHKKRLGIKETKPISKWRDYLEVGGKLRRSVDKVQSALMRYEKSKKDYNEAVGINDKGGMAKAQSNMEKYKNDVEDAWNGLRKNLTGPSEKNFDMLELDNGFKNGLGSGAKAHGDALQDIKNTLGGLQNAAENGTLAESGKDVQKLSDRVDKLRDVVKDSTSKLSRVTRLGLAGIYENASGHSGSRISDALYKGLLAGEGKQLRLGRSHKVLPIKLTSDFEEERNRRRKAQKAWQQLGGRDYGRLRNSFKLSGPGRAYNAATEKLKEVRKRAAQKRNRKQNP